MITFYIWCWLTIKVFELWPRNFVVQLLVVEPGVRYQNAFKCLTTANILAFDMCVYVCCVCRWNTTLGHHVTWVIAVYCFSECRWFFFSSYFCFFHFRCCFRARTATANCPRPHLVDLPFSFLRGNKFTLFMHFLHSNRAKFDRHRAFKRTQIEMSSQRHNVWYMCVLCMWK